MHWFQSTAIPLLLMGLGVREPRRQDPELIKEEPAADRTPVSLGQPELRITVPAVLGSKGPFPFVIDTGAERTVVSRQLAEALGLPPATPVLLRSMTGMSRVDTVRMPELRIPALPTQRNLISPTLEADHLGAPGMLGIDALRGHVLSIDFENNLMRVRPSKPRSRRAPFRTGEIVIGAKNTLGQLIVTDAYFQNTRIQLIIDTGTQMSIGNTALRRRIDNGTMPRRIELTGVTGERQGAPYLVVRGIKVGPIAFGPIPIAFSDTPPFARFGMDRRPALLLGMDALRSFKRVDIDFANRQLHFALATRPRRPL